MPTPEVGASGALTWAVTEDMCTRRADRLLLSSPSMVRLVEAAAIEVLNPGYAAGQSSVGVAVSLDHLAPTPLGMRVTATATVVAVEKRRVEFEIKVDDEVERVGQARHTRYLIDLDRYVERLDKKADLAVREPQQR